MALGCNQTVHLPCLYVWLVQSYSGLYVQRAGMVSISPYRAFSRWYLFLHQKSLAVKIVAFMFENGPCYHRLELPLSQMEGVEVVFVQVRLNEIMDEWADEKVFEGCDLLVYNRVMEGYVMKWLKEVRKKYTFKTCVDIDDHWELGKDHILHNNELEGKMHLIQKGHLILADFVTTTHERLAEEIYPFNKNIHILPNAIPKTGQFNIKTEPSDKVRLFWQGSRTHRKDIEILERPMLDLVRYRNEIKMIMGGVETDEDAKPSEIWYKMKFIFTAGHRIPSAYILGEPVYNYYYTYEQADICLIPLVRSRFNSMKSNLKVLEAANMGLPAIVSQVHPYLGMPVRYCLRGLDWVDHIKELVNSPQKRIDEGAKLRQWADEHYNFKEINEERKRVYEHYVSLKTNNEPAEQGNSGQLPQAS